MYRSGHDIETAYLLLEASEKLGIHQDTVTLGIAKKDGGPYDTKRLGQ